MNKTYIANILTALLWTIYGLMIGRVSTDPIWTLHPTNPTLLQAVQYTRYAIAFEFTAGILLCAVLTAICYSEAVKYVKFQELSYTKQALLRAGKNQK